MRVWGSGTLHALPRECSFFVFVVELDLGSAHRGREKQFAIPGAFLIIMGHNPQILPLKP